MAKVGAGAQIAMRIGLAHKKGFGSHDGATPHHQFYFERDLPETVSDDQMVETAENLHTLARRLAEKKINEDKTDLQRVDN